MGYQRKKFYIGTFDTRDLAIHANVAVRSKLDATKDIGLNLTDQEIRSNVTAARKAAGWDIRMTTSAGESDWEGVVPADRNVGIPGVRGPIHGKWVSLLRFRANVQRMVRPVARTIFHFRSTSWV